MHTTPPTHLTPHIAVLPDVHASCTPWPLPAHRRARNSDDVMIVTARSPQRRRGTDRRRCGTSPNLLVNSRNEGGSLGKAQDELK